MAKTAVLVIHGMGSFQTGLEGELGDFGKSFISSINTALNRHEKHKTRKFEESIDVFEFNYSGFFDDARKKMSDNAKKVAARLAAIDGLGNAEHLVGELSSLDSELSGNKMFYTHWLDVFFYTTLLGASVRASLARRIAALVGKYDGHNVHIIAHSLGTAVLHDTLHLMYRPESDPNLEFQDLTITNHKLRSIWMVANVSRMLDKFTGLTDPYKSIVKPGDHGCCASLFNVHHKFDPFTLPSPFAPINNGSWLGVSATEYISYFHDIPTTLITDKNTHSFTRYVEDPAVSTRMLYAMLDDYDPTINEQEEIVNDYIKKSISGAYAVADNALSIIKEGSNPSWSDYIRAAKALETLKTRISQL